MRSSSFTPLVLIALALAAGVFLLSPPEHRPMMPTPAQLWRIAR